MRKSKYVLNKKKMSECTDAELKEILSIARMHAVRMGKDYLKDDFASFLMEDLIRQGHLNYNLRWRWAHFLRTTVANLKHKKGRAKGLAEMNPIPLKNVVDVESPVQPVDPKPLPDESSKLNNWANRSKNGQERAVLILRNKWGFTLEEVAEVLGVTRERIRQIEHTALLRGQVKDKYWI